MELQEKEEKDERHIGKLFKNNPKIKCIFHSRLTAISMTDQREVFCKQ